MTLTVGLILIGVFLCFAALMCFERLSALLALPLMSLAFLAVALVADLLQPAEVSRLESRYADAPALHFGSRLNVGGGAREWVEVVGPSRFEAWKRQRLAGRRLLEEKGQFLTEAMGRLESALGAGDDRADSDAVGRAKLEIEGIQQSEVAFSRNAMAEYGAEPDPMALPPFHAGPRAAWEQTYRSLVLSDRLRPIRAALDPGDKAGSLASARGMLRDLRREVDAFRTRHQSVPSPDSLRFRAASAAAYVAGYVVLTLRAGSLSLYAAIIATVFGGMFATYIKNLRIAERMVYWTAEFAGERPRVICAAILLVTAVVFTSSGGLGTVIMVGTIVLPILRAVGVGPVIAAGVFLTGIAMGGTLYPATRRLWLDFYGLPADRLDSILWTMVGIYALTGAAWIAWGTRKRMLSNFRSEPDSSAPPKLDVPARLMLAPLVPVALVYLGGVEEITAFVAAMAYMFLCGFRRPGAVRMLSRSMVEGAQVVMPPILLMLGIGLLRTALSTDPVQGYLTPLLAEVTPGSRWSYILTFALAAPLALYRGPLNVWGMGLAIAATLLATSSLSPAAILCALLATGMLQSVCDPTNTQNVWIAGFQGVTVNQIMRQTVPVVWIAAAAAVTWFGLRYVGN